MRFTAVSRWLAASTEFEPTLLGGRALERLVQERMDQLAISDELAYLALLQSNGEELERVLARVAVSETSFFRYADSYQALARWLGDRRAAAADPGTTLRMLSIACATGEEPCSMAITAAHVGWDLDCVHIDAVDRSAAAIAKARAGRYPANALGRAVPQWARRWFNVDDHQLQVQPAVLRAIRFRHANVFQLPLPPPPGYDVVFCRNLMIYLGDPARRRLTAWLARALAGDGRLFLGHAESGVIQDGPFIPVEEPRAFAFEPEPASAARAAARTALPTPRRPERALADAMRPVQTRPAPIRPAPIRPAVNGHDEAPSLARARALADRGELRAAEEMARAVLAASGPTADLLELLGSVHLSGGAMQEAHGCFFRAVYLDPSHQSSLLQLALICDRMGDTQQATRYRQRAGRALQDSDNP